MSGNDSTYVTTFGDGTSVLERVLLAIINAHTADDTEGRQAERLQSAMTALVGPAGQGRHDAERALLFMVQQRQKDICDLELRALRSFTGGPRRATRSVLELASLAARDVMGCTSVAEVQANASVLCEMFRKRGHAYDVEPDHVRETLEREAMRRILDELAEWDVPSIISN